MPKSLEMFHFDPVKFGLIVKRSAKEKGVSQTYMAARTGLSYDTVGNIYAGKIQKFAFEHLFKICVVLGMSVEVMMLLLLKDEEIDFEEEILLYDTSSDKLVPVHEAIPSMVPGPVPEAVADTAIEAAERLEGDGDSPYGYFTHEEVMEHIQGATKQLISEVDYLRKSLQANQEMHDRYVCNLQSQHEKHIADLKEQHLNERAIGKQQQEWLQKFIENSIASKRLFK